MYKNYWSDYYATQHLPESERASAMERRRQERRQRYNVEVPVCRNGTYDLFPYPRGRGYSPASDGKWRHGPDVIETFLFSDENEERWRFDAIDKTMAQVIERFNEIRGTMVRGDIYVRANCYKPYPNWAWEVEEVHYVLITPEVKDVVLYRLSVENTMDMVFESFVTEKNARI